MTNDNIDEHFAEISGENEEKRLLSRAGKKDLIWGFIVLAIGIGITLGTWFATGPGGDFWVMWGLIGTGLFGVFRGLYRKVKAAPLSGRRTAWIIGTVATIGALIGGGFGNRGFIAGLCGKGGCLARLGALFEIGVFGDFAFVDRFRVGYVGFGLLLHRGIFGDGSGFARLLRSDEGRKHDRVVKLDERDQNGDHLHKAVFDQGLRQAAPGHGG